MHFRGGFGRDPLPGSRKSAIPPCRSRASKTSSPPQIRTLLDKHGLVCCACHESLAQLRSDLPGIVSKLKTLGANFTALGHPGGSEPVSASNLPSFIAELEGYAVRFAAEGLRFGYHNHSLEFERQEGKTVLGRIYDGAPHLYGEPDTHWIQRGGGDPVAWIRRLAGRLPAVHLKDYVWRDGEARFAEVGHGNLDWDGILSASREAGAEYYIVEQDDPTPGRDIFDSVALSYEFLKDRVC